MNLKNTSHFLFLTLYNIFIFSEVPSHICLQVNRGRTMREILKRIHIHATAEYASHSTQLLYPLEIQKRNQNTAWFSFKFVLIQLILLVSLWMAKISHDCDDTGSGPKSVLHGQFQKATWENSVPFKHTSHYRRIYITKDHEQPCTELTAWSRQNVGEYCADPYLLE